MDTIVRNYDFLKRPIGSVQGGKVQSGVYAAVTDSGKRLPIDRGFQAVYRTTWT